MTAMTTLFDALSDHQLAHAGRSPAVAQSASRRPSTPRRRKPVRPTFEWLEARTLLAAQCIGPAAIYSLGNANPPGSTSNIRDLDFVSGFSQRIVWKEIETAAGQYDFSKIDEAVASLQAINQRLTLEVFNLEPPPHVLATVSETWLNQQFNVTTAVPWDAAAQNAWNSFMRVLGDHLVADASQGGALVRFADHPTLETVLAPIVGLLSIRENSGTLVAKASYTRTTFIDAVAQSVHASRDVFADHFGFLGFFTMTDGQDASYGGKTLDTMLLERLRPEFNDPGQPTLGLFQENLSDALPATGGVLGKNLLAFGEGYIMFQALTSWTNPVPGYEDEVASGNPKTGLKFAFDNYGATYAELYVNDLDNTALSADLRTWHTTLSDAARNDAPSFTKGSNQTVLEDAAA